MLSNHSAFAQMNRLRNELERVFGTDTSSSGTAHAYPRVNVWEDETNVFLEAELPGVNLDDLKIHIMEGDELSIKGERSAPVLEDAVWKRRERTFGEFERSFKLGSDIDFDEVSATMKDGLLQVTLPKAAAAKPRKIEISQAD